MSEKAAQDRATLPACIVNSLPKSGTHLLKKIIGLLPGMTSVDLHLGPEQGYPDVSSEPETGVPLGVGRPRLMPREKIHSTLASLEQGNFITGHIPYSKGMATLLWELGIKIVSIIRDPRDVAVSQAQFVANRPGTPLHDYYRTLSEEQRIMTAIVGIRQLPSGPVLRNLRERVESVLQWDSQPQSLLTFFERLVGPQGGGSRELQRREINAIALHLGVECTAQEVDSVADRAFGDTATFHTGMIGTWRRYFTDEHKRACKELLGQLLIDLGYEKNLDW
jgi:hypothetical protein